MCSGSVDVGSRHVLIEGSSIQVFCSAECMQSMQEDDDLAELDLQPDGGRAGQPRGTALRALVGGGALLGMLFLSDAPPVPPPAPPPAKSAAVVIPLLPLPSLPPQDPGPSPEEQATMDAILRDVWLHPLPGPARRMPVIDGRVFGAERPGERPAECRNGHCGVDIGGEEWGEPVMAVHDGVVDRVVRGPNEEHGGLYVRLAHRGGTVFTQYFHLAAIPRWIVPGKKIAAGEVIGLVGDSGVKESGPHLHFTISIKPAPDRTERYIDPEPLIALWPLRIRSPYVTAAGVVTDAAPGLVRGAANRRAKLAARSAAEAATSEPPAATPAPPAAQGDAPPVP
jgi:murein DD-endopeptidase MepM/ murein hydrolase activator NlpD